LAESPVISGFAVQTGGTRGLDPRIYLKNELLQSMGRRPGGDVE
jgi:hypothetical protein